MPENISFTHNDYEVIERKVLYQGVFRLVRYALRYRLFKGGWSAVLQREVFERHSAVGILPYDPLEDKVILIEQFRPGTIGNPASPWLVEVPAGIIEPNETPEDVAYRETMEETGCTLSMLHPISDYFVSPGGSNEYLHLYCGKVDAKGVEGIYGLQDEQEDIRVINLSADEAFAKVQSGQIKNAPALIALLWLQLNRQTLKSIWL